MDSLKFGRHKSVPICYVLLFYLSRDVLLAESPLSDMAGMTVKFLWFWFCRKIK